MRLISEDKPISGLVYATKNFYWEKIESAVRQRMHTNHLSEFGTVPDVDSFGPFEGRLGALKSQTRYVQAINKCIDDPADMIIRNQLFRGDWKKSSLRTALTLHKAHKKFPRFHEGIFSFIFRRSTEFRNSLKRGALLQCVAGFAELMEGERHCSCLGPIRTEYTIIEHPVPQRIDPLSCLNLMFSGATNDGVRRSNRESRFNWRIIS
jgi:hypothetical protein